MLCPIQSRECQKENCTWWRINDCCIQGLTSALEEIADQMGFDRQKSAKNSRKEDVDIDPQTE